jgi:hypothetical protein
MTDKVKPFRLAPAGQEKVGRKRRIPPRLVLSTRKLHRPRFERIVLQRYKITFFDTDHPFRWNDESSDQS